MQVSVEEKGWAFCNWVPRWWTNLLLCWIDSKVQDDVMLFLTTKDNRSTSNKERKKEKKNHIVGWKREKDWSIDFYTVKYAFIVTRMNSKELKINQTVISDLFSWFSYLSMCMAKLKEHLPRKGDNHLWSSDSQFRQHELKQEHRHKSSRRKWVEMSMCLHVDMLDSSSRYQVIQKSRFLHSM